MQRYSSHSRIIALVAVLTLVVACTGEDVQVAPLHPKAQRVQSPPTTGESDFATLVTQKEIDCCWCVMKPDNHNEVRRYGDSSLCEERSGKLNYKSCQKVRALGNVCTLTKLKRLPRGKFECSPLPLKYYAKGGEIAEITPPEDLSGPCRPETWFDTPAAPMAKGGKGGSGGGGSDDQKQDIHCGCSRDPENDKACRAYKSTDGQILVLDVKPLPAGEINCLRSTCEKLWDFSQFIGICPRRYVQGPP